MPFAAGKRFCYQSFKICIFTGHQCLKPKMTPCHYILDALDCLNSVDFQQYPTMTMFALTQAVAESIWSIL